MAKKEKTASKGASKKGSKNESPSKGTGEGLKPPACQPRLRELYKKEIIPALMKELNIENPMQLPRLSKITLNAGLGRSTQNIKIIETALRDLSAIAGQKAVATKSKIAISNFKLRAGLPIGVMVTLRGVHMWEFLDRLVSLALPRIRDFRGVSDRGFDGRGNFTMGLKDHFVFPEVDYDTADSSFGLNITMVTSTDSDEHARALIEKLGFPFRKRAQRKAA